MKRSLRSRNSCLPIQNIFEKEMKSDISDLIELIPQQILKNLSKKKFILCEDLLNMELANKPNQRQLYKIRTASKLLKEKCEKGLQKMRKIQQRPTVSNNSFFDCLLNQQEFPRKIIKCEPLSYDELGNNKNKFQYKIEYSYDNEDGVYGIGQNFLNFQQKKGDCIREHDQNCQKVGK